MTTFTSLTELSGQAETSTTAGLSAALRGAAETSTNVSGTIRILKANGTRIVTFENSEAITSTDTEGAVHLIVALRGTSFTSTDTKRGDGVRSLFEPLQTRIANGAYSTVQSSFMPLTAKARGPLPVPDYAISTTSFFGLVGTGRMLTGEIGQVSSSFNFLESRVSSGPYAIVSASFKFMTSIISQGPGNDVAEWYEFVALQTPTTSVGTFLVIYNENVTIVGTATTIAIYEETILQALQLVNTYTAAAQLTAIIQEAIYIASVLNKEPAPDVWVVNQNSLASSQYKNFNFNSMAVLKGMHYGADETGIFELNGYTDDGAQIEASITTGVDDFGVHTKQSVPLVYIGGNTAAPMMLTALTDDGQVNEYSVPAVSQLHNERAVLGKGLRSRY